VGETSDEAVLADADLAILGAAPSRYDRYVLGIRQEYAHLSDNAFQRGRAAWIDLWSQRECLFRTPALRDVGEAAARENLARERASYR
jgi:predicted metal-dependent HD superfamily phosphohydrolase